MKHSYLPALIVAALIMFDISLTAAYAETKITIFKVAKVSKQGELMMRAWPSPKSRIVQRLPCWVNAHYLEKTGVLLHANKIASRNPNATAAASPSISKVTATPAESLNDKPQEFAGDRYDQPIQEANEAVSAEKVSYSDSIAQRKNQQILSCNGKSPSHWNIKLDMSGKNIQIKFPH